MRRASLRTLALLLTLTLLAQLFPLSALADAPSFSNLYDACDYLRTCMDARETEIALFLDENACARWETDEVREALEDTMAMAGLIGVRVDRHEDRSADVRISIEYCDAVRMVDAYRRAAIFQGSPRRNSNAWPWRWRPRRSCARCTATRFRWKRPSTTSSAET